VSLAVKDKDYGYQLYAQGDKYFFGHGASKSNDTAFKRYMVTILQR
jgi:hypothetical protein